MAPTATDAPSCICGRAMRREGGLVIEMGYGGRQITVHHENAAAPCTYAGNDVRAGVLMRRAGMRSW